MADFKTAFLFTLQHEDSTYTGKVTVDAGGRTRFGIAEKFHPDLPEEFFTGPTEDALAEAEKIEESEYWGRMRLAEIENQNVANKLFDMGVNMGVRQAGVYAQRAARVVEDGVIGPKNTGGHQWRRSHCLLPGALRAERGTLSARGGSESGAGGEPERVDETGGSVMRNC